ncbi:hypothetical protein [Ralstonia mannitolilytica]|uniref:Uncharacterized protein n=1 Tax=Ralstonia mannitolilytica TaxID=105219 RepID=A0AAJ4ZMG0_9RALS|nr:hypothetical protein [Ralstonia mannitolilytica]CAG2135141.1 hypothetical protein LMG6866_01214 [Ralstonia mannitolilytica]CAJ0731268.1 hypothetical protein R77592_02610 [Ralstonia mannitolilytica]SUD88402.1 Uncharacterised protein [Ralstonia mannitolilytica]SUD98062.1 Uncharacterised protein [Ralstonia mannitolilytica]
MIARTIPITQVKPDLKDSLRMAVAEIERFLAMFYPAEAIDQTHAAKAIAGQWLSRVKGFHEDDDFLHLVRDFLSYVLSGGEHSRISDQLAYYFSGFMPSYGSACILLGMVADGLPWSEVQAFMHSQSYGNAREYIETFDWASGRKRADAEVDAWLAILREQDTRLQTAMTGEPVLLAFAPPSATPNGPVTDVPARGPLPAPRPPVPVASPEPEAQMARRLAPSLIRIAKVPSISLWPLLLLLVPANALRKNTEDEDMRKLHEQYARQQKLVVRDTQQKAEATTDQTNNECKAQIKENQKNGAVCENDGYVLMESALQYKRLVNPPKGRGLDGLFEKLPAFDQPAPMPETVTVPKPGKLLFIPTDKKPPRPEYDYVATALKKPAAPTYPKFVVLEAKHIAKALDPSDPEKISKEAKARLGNTCDGLQMSEPWTEKRIPQALARKDSGLNPAQQKQKRQEITDAEYARWLFVCLPGPVGSAQPSKLFVLIDVVATGLDLESRAPKARAPRPNSGNEL